MENHSDSMLSNVVLSDIESNGRRECSDIDRTDVAGGDDDGHGIVGIASDVGVVNDSERSAATTADNRARQPIDNDTSNGRSDNGVRQSINSSNSTNAVNPPTNDTNKCQADLLERDQRNCDSNSESASQSQQSKMYQPIRSTDTEDEEADDDVPARGFGRTSRRSPTLASKKKRNASAKNCDSDDDAHSKHVLYNDFVNLLCDTDISGAAANEAARKRTQASGSQNQHNGTLLVDINDRRAEFKPLLFDQGSAKVSVQRRADKPKSIVKSPSTQTFGSSDKYFDGNRKPRLSIQCTGSDPERPVLHVQFLQYPEAQHGLSQSLPQQAQHAEWENGGRSAGVANQTSFDMGSSLRTRSSISSSTSSSSSDDESSGSSSDEDTIGQFAEAKAPDGGWGWVVVFASFMVNLIADGITFSFGVIYVEFLNYFGEGKAKTAWIGSLFMAMPLLSGPVASFLTDRYGCRKVTIAGSILASLGFFISAFVDSMEMLFFTFGILAGFGLSLCYVAAVVIVAYYFDKRRSFATGLSVCGSGIGTFIFAPLTQILIDEYGWRGTTLILSGLFLNMCVCGMLMRDLEWTTYRAKLKAKARKKRHQLGISAESFSVSNSTNTGGTTSNNPNHQESNTVEFYKTSENGDNGLANQSEKHAENHRLFSSLITLPTFVKNGEKVNI